MRFNTKILLTNTDMKNSIGLPKMNWKGHIICRAIFSLLLTSAFLLKFQGSYGIIEFSMSYDESDNHLLVNVIKAKVRKVNPSYAVYFEKDFLQAL